MADLIGQPIGQYEIIGLLGEGGMAVVYRARQPSMKREVAIKVIKYSLIENREFVSRFEREAQAAASLSHPFILKVFDYGQQADLVYLVMELLAGGSLAEVIRQGPLPPEQMIQVLEQIASALDYAHQKGIIHRDLKPQNVLLDEAGNAHLTDFGIVKLMDAGAAALTQSGAVMGTPTYMAPEQWQGRPVDARADLYALGVMLFEMLAGQAPFKADTPFSLMYMHIFDSPPSIRLFQPMLPAELEAVVEKALAKAPDQRFQSAAELVSAFKAAWSVLPTQEAAATRQARDAEPIAVPTVVGVPTTTSRHSRRKLGGIALAAITIGLLVMAVWGRLETGRTTPTATPTATVGVVIEPSLTAHPVTLAPPLPSPTVILAATLPATNTPTATPPPIAPGSERLDARGVTMVYVPAGCFLMGSDPAHDSQVQTREQPQHNVCLTRGFWIDKYEVTNAAYQVFIDDGGYRRREFWSDQGWQWKGLKTQPQNYDGFNGDTKPRIGITWYEADAYAKWRGGRLPTEAEWEYAARGKDGRIYPWGNRFDGKKLNYCDKNCTENGHDLNISDGFADAAPVGSYPDGKSWVNAYDTAGNVWEWIADWFDDTYYHQMVSVDPAGPPSGTLRGLRGGSWFDVTRDNPFRAAHRQGNEPDRQWTNLGVRVVSFIPDQLGGTPGNLARLNRNLALGKPVIASQSDQYPAQLAVDGEIDFPNAWGAGAPPPQWIEVNLEAPATITEIRLRVVQSPDGNTVHQVFGRGPTDEFHLLNEFSGVTADGQWLIYVPPTAWTGIQFIKVVTVQSPSWVGWREIEIVGTVG